MNIKLLQVQFKKEVQYKQTWGWKRRMVSTEKKILKTGENCFNKLNRFTNMAPTHCTLANLFGYGYWHGNSPTNNMYKGLYWSTFREKCLA